MKRRIKIPSLLAPGLILAFFVVLVMKSRRAGDFYSLHVYPAVSSVLSLTASPFGISLQAVLIVIFLAAFVWIIVSSCRRRTGLPGCLLKELTLIVWIFVWAYAGWCLNYSRTPITARVEAAPASYDSTEFRAFLERYTDELNASWVPEVTLDEDEVEGQIKAFYTMVPEEYGLCTPKGWQHPKKMPLRRFESAMGILGYIGPFFCESHLNPDLPASELPFTFAHEFSHLLGVSSEAEANWWAYQCCRCSCLPAMRYCGSLGILPSVAGNAARLLSEDDFRQWSSTIRQEVKDDYNANREYWESLCIPLLDKSQRWIYNLFLKGNNIPSGVANYSEVICLLISLEDFQQ